MSCGAIRKQKYTESMLPESKEAGKFEAVAIDRLQIWRRSHQSEAFR